MRACGQDTQSQAAAWRAERLPVIRSCNRIRDSIVRRQPACMDEGQARIHRAPVVRPESRAGFGAIAARRHCAVMIARAAAARGKACVGIRTEERTHQRQAGETQQQNGNETPQEISLAY